jgi:hypothetical protein
MGKIGPGNSANSKLNGEWAIHARRSRKQITAGLRRLEGKRIIRSEMEEPNCVLQIRPDGVAL